MKLHLTIKPLSGGLMEISVPRGWHPRIRLARVFIGIGCRILGCRVKWIEPEEEAKL